MTDASVNIIRVSRGVRRHYPDQHLFSLRPVEKKLAPQEDKGIVISLLTTAPNATLEQTRLFSQELYTIFASYEEAEHIFQLDGINGINSSIAGMVMKPWDQRTRTSVDLNPEVQMKLAGIAGGQAVSFLPSPFPAAETVCRSSLSSAPPSPSNGSTRLPGILWARLRPPACSPSWTTI